MEEMQGMGKGCEASMFSLGWSLYPISIIMEAQHKNLYVSF